MDRAEYSRRATTSSRMNHAIRSVFLLMLACSNPTGSYGDVAAIKGGYTLESVNGKLLPAEIAVTVGCTRTVTRGGLDLTGPTVDVRPLYSSEILTPTSCQPGSPNPTAFIEDFGTWTFDAPTVHFASQKGRGNYSGTQQSTGSETILTIEIDGNSYVFRRSPETPKGILFVTFVDQTNAPVNGVTVRFGFPDGGTGGGTTQTDGQFGTSGTAGVWNVTITPPFGYIVPTSQANPFQVNVPASVTYVTVHLTKS